MCDKSQDDRLQLQLNIMLQATKFFCCSQCYWVEKAGTRGSRLYKVTGKTAVPFTCIKCRNSDFTGEGFLGGFVLCKPVKTILPTIFNFQWAWHALYCDGLLTESQKIAEEVADHLQYPFPSNAAVPSLDDSWLLATTITWNTQYPFGELQRDKSISLFPLCHYSGPVHCQH